MPSRAVPSLLEFACREPAPTACYRAHGDATSVVGDTEIASLCAQ